MSEITPDIVREYNEFTPKFLCGLDANTYNIKFKKFKMRDLESDFVLFEVSDDSPDDSNNSIEKKEEEEKKESINVQVNYY